MGFIIFLISYFLRPTSFFTIALKNFGNFITFNLIGTPPYLKTCLESYEKFIFDLKSTDFHTFLEKSIAKNFNNHRLSRRFDGSRV